MQDYYPLALFFGGIQQLFESDENVRITKLVMTVVGYFLIAGIPGRFNKFLHEICYTFKVGTIYGSGCHQFLVFRIQRSDDISVIVGML